LSSYTKATNFASKDALASGNALKIVKGTELDNEFNAIASAVNSKIEGYNALLTGTPTAPTASASAYTTQVATTAFVHDVLPKGIIMLWSGSSASIPFGWALCNGSSSTPDLRDRFVIGAGTTYAVAATGGSKDAIVVSHLHALTTASTVSAGAHTHGFELGDNNNDNLAPAAASNGVLVAPDGVTFSAGAHTHTLTGNTDTTGESGTNANLPPYYALCYIMKTTGI
jgi:hypothetical protein